MLTPPDRLEGLVARIEAGETITQREVDRFAALQALDIEIGRASCRERV